MIFPLSKVFETGRPDDLPVAIRDKQIITFGQFKSDILKFSVPKTPCRAALVLEDSYEFLIGFYALLQARCIIIFLPNSLSGTLKRLENEFDILIDKDFHGEKLSNFKKIDSNYDQLRFFTSGSTGEPKCIVKNLPMLEAEINTLEEKWGGELKAHSLSVYATVPHYHFYGLIFKILWPLATGRAFSAPTYIAWEGLQDDLKGDAIIVSSPAHLKRLAGINRNADQNILKVFSAGAALSYEVSIEVMNILGCLPTEIFGSTETGALATRQSIGENQAWELLPDVSMRCENDGRLAVKSPYSSKDWYVTDDLVKPHEQGFHFIGRADSVVKLEGKRVSLVHVEKSLQSLAYIKDCFVFIKSEQLAAVIALTKQGEDELQNHGKFRFERKLRESLRADLLPVELPKLWRFVNSLPLQETGKRDLSAIHKLFEAAG